MNTRIIMLYFFQVIYVWQLAPLDQIFLVFYMQDWVICAILTI